MAGSKTREVNQARLVKCTAGCRRMIWLDGALPTAADASFVCESCTKARAALPPARRRALEAMAGAHPRPARVSNVTATTGGAGAALVYWQSADWLTGQDPALARPADSGGLVLTTAGLAVCREHGIEVRQ